MIGTTMINTTVLQTTAFGIMRRAAPAFLLVTLGVSAAAAPNIPSSELPGRARQQFQDSPIDRFTQPNTQQQQPLYRWDCAPQKSRKGKSRSKRAERC